MSNKLTVALCKEKLTAKGFSGGPVTFDGRYLGCFVTHGHRSGNGKTVYASRISFPFRIEVAASNRTSMLAKVAKELSRGANENGLLPSDIGKSLEEI